jgi:hypothetical protein
MNTTKSIYNKLFSESKSVSEKKEIQLSNHEIALSLATDMVGYTKAIAKGNTDVLSMNKNIFTLKGEYAALAKLVNEKVATISRLQKSVSSEYDTNKKALLGKGKFALNLKKKFEDSAKEMGLNPSTSAEYKALVDAINNNMWLSIMNIENKDYFFKDSDAAYNDLTSAVAKIKK